MDDLAKTTIEAVKSADIAYSKFITPNDAGETGGHQSGFHIHRNSYKIAFTQQGVRGSNDEKFVTIKWQNDFETQSRFTYYGTGTRNEYRLTRFGNGFPFLSDVNVGSLLVLCKKTDDYYLGYVLDKDEDIEEFLMHFDINPSNANGIIKELNNTPHDIMTEFTKYIQTLDGIHFPSTEDISRSSRDIFARCNTVNARDIIDNPDTNLASWVDTEYKLFKAIEDVIYAPLLSRPAENVEELVATANMVLNRRKSRAGKSLEHHLASVFDSNNLPYSAQKQTEYRNKPDFILPSIEDYHSLKFPDNKLIFLGAKTTCKDRWRQVLSEADRIPHKYLFTLQPSISSNQLDEMKKSQVTLVVPEQNITTFPLRHREDILSLKTFIRTAKQTLLS